MRRLGGLLWSMYVDDSNVVDLKAAMGKGQALGGIIFEMLGTPIAPKKRQPMATTGDFLGVTHDVSQVAVKGTVSFTPKQSLVEKAVAQLSAALSANHLEPGEASKLRGLLKFLALPTWHGIGKAAMGPTSTVLGTCSI